jgi:hypothetical protein
MTPNADRVRQRTARRNVGTTQSGPADIFPTDIRIDGGKRKEVRLRKSRLIITDNALYVAASKDAGRTVEWVRKYPLPKGERVVKASNSGTWGDFSWNPCGCANSWGRHTKAALIELADG